jgi:peptidoglycan hydrolase-like protein with peptidoglycan-binding domain
MAQTILDWPLVKKGDDAFPVRSLQHLLRARNHPVTVDGIFGPRTESAVKKGDTGDAVRGVQEVIQFHDQSDNPPNHVDGIFGPKTDQWVRGFQTAVGTPADGIVGPITWRAMVSGMLSG